MVQLIEQIFQMKEYRPETFFLAVNIADRYLALLAVMHGLTPSLIELGVISIMLAAKINEHLSPSYYNIIKIINSQQQKKLLYRSNLLAIEANVLNALSFDLHSTTILFFLERFQRVFGLEPVSARYDDTCSSKKSLKQEKSANRRTRSLDCSTKMSRGLSLSKDSGEDDFLTRGDKSRD